MKVNLTHPEKSNEIDSVVIEDHDLWNCDYTLALIITPLLKRFKETTISYPSGIESIEEWHSVLDAMIYSFKEASKIYEFDFDLGKSAYDEYMKKVQHGFDLFGKYYMGLWD